MVVQVCIKVISDMCIINYSFHLPFASCAIICITCTENEEVLATTPQRSMSEKLPPRQEGSTQSYTPYIKYTKLEFKVQEKEKCIVYSCYCQSSICKEISFEFIYLES